MVKKLLKYEFSALAKPLLPMEIILFSIAIFNRIVQFFENNGTTYNIFIISSSILLGIAMITSLVFTFAVCIVRFYRNLYTSQGYLTLTLPVTHTEHLWAKLLSSVCCMVLSFVFIFLALSISTAGDVFYELMKAVGYLLNGFFKITKAHGAFYIAEFIIWLVLAVAGEFLLIYTCITVGQRAAKNRILLAFGVYFGIYIAWQIIGTLFMIIAAALAKTDFYANLLIWISKHLFTFFHLLLCGMVVLTLLFCIVCFLINRRIMKKKLNLE